MKVLFIIKPGFLEVLPKVVEILSKFTMLNIQKYRFSQQEAEVFYQEHRDRSFFNSLIKYMISGESYIMIYDVPSIEVARKIVGNTNPELADVGTIRKSFGKNIEENCIHCSDSEVSAEREINFFKGKTFINL